MRALVRRGTAAGTLFVASHVFDVSASAQSAALGGRVVDELRAAVGAAQISVTTITGSTSAAQSDAAGRFLISGLTTGRARVRVLRIGAAPLEQEVTLIGGDTVEVELVLLAPAREWIGLTPAIPLPRDSIRKSVPDSAIVRSRQVLVAVTRPVAFDESRLQLFDDLLLTLRVNRVSDFGARGFTASGTVATGSGRTRGIAATTLDGDRFVASLRVGSRLYLIRPQLRGVHLVMEVDLMRLPSPAEPGYDLPLPPPNPPPLPPDPVIPDFFKPPFDFFPIPLTYFELGPHPPIPARNACSDAYNMGLGRRAELRLLMAYTATTESTAPGIVGLIGNAVTEMVAALEESGVEVDITIVGIERVTLAETALANDMVKAFVATAPDPEIVRLREIQKSLAADVIGLTVSAESMGNAAFRMLHPHRTFADSAVFVANWVNMDNNFSLAHEFGHVLGGEHLRTAGTVLPWRFNYAYAHECLGCSGGPDGLPGWVTIMGLAKDLQTARIGRYSNPESFWDGRPTGAGLLTASPADHRLAFQRALSTVASLRTTPVWLTSTFAAAPWEERRVETKTYRDALLGDFDGDRVLDALRVNATTGQWDWVSHLEGAWVMRSAADPTRAVPLASLLVGSFDTAPGADVLWIDSASDQWKLSSGGMAPWVVVAGPDPTLDVPIEELAVADFNGNGIDDIFRTQATVGTWTAALDARLPWTPLGPAADPERKYERADLAFGDFDGDLRADVFRSDDVTGTWYYVPDGTGNWAVLNGPSALLRYSTRTLAVGAFNADAQADVLATTGFQWMVSDGGRLGFRTRRASCHRSWELRFHDIDGDGMLDVLRVGQRP